MNGMNEVITIAKYYSEWSDPRLIIAVLKNCDLNMVTWEQRVMAGDPKFMASQAMPDFPYADFARSLGLTGIRVERPESIGAAWDEALQSDRPTIIEFHTDPEVPPLPPHITKDQAKKFLESLMKDPARGSMLKESMKEMFASVLK
jgi:pyruvate dehydrogenase (quinone)